MPATFAGSAASRSLHRLWRTRTKSFAPDCKISVVRPGPRGLSQSGQHRISHFGPVRSAHSFASPAPHGRNVREPLKTSGRGKYHGVIGTARAIVAEEGWRGLYRGLGTNLYVAFADADCIICGFGLATAFMPCLIDILSHTICIGHALQSHALSPSHLTSSFYVRPLKPVCNILIKSIPRAVSALRFLRICMVHELSSIAQLASRQAALASSSSSNTIKCSRRASWCQSAPECVVCRLAWRSPC